MEVTDSKNENLFIPCEATLIKEATVKSSYNDIGIIDIRVTAIFSDRSDRDCFAGNHSWI